VFRRKRWKEARHADARVGLDWTNDATVLKGSALAIAVSSAELATGSAESREINVNNSTYPGLIPTLRVPNT
jgi:hypothetical protein